MSNKAIHDALIALKSCNEGQENSKTVAVLEAIVAKLDEPVKAPVPAKAATAKKTSKK